MVYQKFSDNLTRFIQNLDERVILLFALLGSIYGFFHFGIEDEALVSVVRVLFILLISGTLVTRYIQRNPDETKPENRQPETTMPDKQSDLETIQRLADQYQLKHRVDTEQDFKLFLNKILSAILSTFVSHSGMVYLWDIENNQFVLKAWAPGSLEILEDHVLLPEEFPIDEMLTQKKAFREGDCKQEISLTKSLANAAPVKSILAVPIFIENEVVGLLCLHSISKEAFGSDDEILLNSFAEIISKTILNYNTIYESETSSWLFSSFYEISKELNSGLKFDEILQMLIRIVKSIFEYDRMTISLVESDDPEKAKIAEVVGQEDDFGKGYIFPLNEGLNGWVIRKNKSILVSDLEKGEYFIARYTNSEKSNFHLRSFLAAPIGFSVRCMGAIAVESRKPNLYVERHENILVMLCNNIGAALERSIIYQQLESMATTDGLTGLHNYRSFRLRLNEEISRAHRYHMEFSLVIMDIDHFKDFNDRYGHLVGDRVLQNLSQILKLSLRNIDFVARYGGEEFCAILLNTTGASARMSAERIRKNVEESPLELDEQRLMATLSLGVASFPDDADQEEELIHNADKALYRAKAGGRNRVVLYSDGLKT